MPRTKKSDILKENQTKVTKKNSDNFISAVGRRREAVARVRLYSKIKDDISWGDKIIKKGEMFVNQMPIDKYFSGAIAKLIYQEPFRVTNSLNMFTTTIKVSGGGKKGQMEAMVHAVARALDKFDKEKFHKILKKRKFLTRDPRTRERRKVGTGGKARRKKQSPKR